MTAARALDTGQLGARCRRCPWGAPAARRRTTGGGHRLLPECAATRIHL